MILTTLITIMLLSFNMALHEVLLTPDLGQEKKYSLARKIVRNVFLVLVLLIIATLFRFWRDETYRVYISCIPVIILFNTAFDAFYGLLVHRRPDFLGSKGWDGLVSRWFHGGKIYLFVRLFAFFVLHDFLFRVLR